MSYEPNDLAARYLLDTILPIRNCITKTLIAGKSPSISLKRQSSTTHIPGFLDDLVQAYGNTKIFVAPMQSGSGLQNKILEAMAAEPLYYFRLTNQSLKAIDETKRLSAIQMNLLQKSTFC